MQKRRRDRPQPGLPQNSLWDNELHSTHPPLVERDYQRKM